MDANIYHNWTPLTGVLADETNLKVRSLKRKPTREKTERKGPTTRAVERIRYSNPTMDFTMDADITTRSGNADLAVGRAIAADLANFTGAGTWREHDPDDGIVILEDAEDTAEADGDEPLTTTMTFRHYPFVT
jgi:hypothetical protein